MESNLAPGRFYGEALQSREADGFSLVKTAYAPGLRLPRHAHARAYFCLVLRGAFTETDGRRTRACHASTLIFRPAAEEHRDQFQSAGGQCFNIDIAPRWLAHVGDYAALPAGSVAFRGGLIVSLAARLYQEFRRADEVSALVMECLALEMLATAARARAERTTLRAPQWLTRARELLHANFAERVTPGAVAAEVGVHPVHLARVFRRHQRCTIGEYVRRLRIEYACRELAATDAPLAQVALAAGFSQQSHFSHTFKQHTGQTPAQYRAAFRPR